MRGGLVVAVVVAVIVALTAAPTRASAARPTTTTTSTAPPTTTTAAPSAAAPATATATARDPIVFVHGYGSNGSIWAPMMRRFVADGWTDAQLVAWTYDTSQSNATTAQQLSTVIDVLLASTGASRVDIVAHSMGSLSSRWYLKYVPGGMSKVDAWVSLGGPNHGTDTAMTCSTTPCLEMRPGSAFLTQLNSGDESPGTVRYGTWWSPCDLTINPDSSVSVDGAVNTETGCLGHSDLYNDSTVYPQVRDFVR